MLTFDLCGLGYGKALAHEELRPTIDDMVLTYKNDNIQVQAKDEVKQHRQSIREMQKMTKQELTQEYNTRVNKQSIAVVKTRACQLF